MLAYLITVNGVCITHYCFLVLHNHMYCGVNRWVGVIRELCNNFIKKKGVDLFLREYSIYHILLVF